MEYVQKSSSLPKEQFTEDVTPPKKLGIVSQFFSKSCRPVLESGQSRIKIKLLAENKEQGGRVLKKGDFVYEPKSANEEVSEFKNVTEKLVRERTDSTTSSDFFDALEGPTD